MRTLATLLAVLLPVASPITAQEQGDEQPAIRQWIDKLGDTAYQARQRAQKMLEKAGDKATAALKKAAEEHQDPEVRWRARRLLRLIEKGPADLQPRDGKKPVRRLPRAWRDRDLDKMFDSLFERLEQDFDFDVPRRHFFRDPFFQDLRQQMREVRERMERAVDADLHSSTRSVQLRIDSDGVELRIRQGDGEKEAKIYSALSLEEFQQKYPEIAREYIGETMDGLRFELGPHLLFDVQPAPPQEAASQQGPQLGIVARPLPTELREFLSLPRAEGLLVARVVPDSLAARIGMQVRDILLEVNGQRIRGTSDVRSALLRDEKAVAVLINRKGQEKQLKADR